MSTRRIILDQEEVGILLALNGTGSTPPRIVFNNEIIMLVLILKAGIHGIPQAVTNIIEGQNTDKDHETWVENLGGLGPHFVLVFIKHVAPGGHRWLDAETQEG